MKKSVFILSLLILFLFPLISAQANDTQINKGFSCLNTQVGDCSSASLNEQIFASLANGKCTSLIAGSSNNGCWPSGSCDIKTTAQAMLALRNSGLPTSSSEAWLSTKQIKTSDINWFLQINTNSNATCSVSYSGSSYTINLNADKSISSAAGNCFSVSPNGYWFSVSPNCYGTQFNVSCNQAFTTTKLYQRQDDLNYPTIYVSSSSNSAPSGSKIIDSINSSCFGSGSCNYEATLWSALALNSLGNDISQFIPYLTVFAKDASNIQYLPYSFLYLLTNSPDYLNSLLSQQKTVNGQSYWDVGSSYGPYYDTALALLPLQGQNGPEKTNAVDWLMSVQDQNGCWNSGNIVDTAFILYSISGSKVQRTATTDCVSSGKYCISGVNCNQVGGSILQSYTCPNSLNICCSKNITTPSCSSQSGTICSSGQSCSGTTTSASDVSSGQTCCIGTCTSAVLTPSNCELSGGICRSSCYPSEQPSSNTCALGNELCCVQQQQNQGSVWIWILAVVIALSLVGIIFRKKLSVMTFRLKSKFKGGGKAQPGLPPRPPFPPRPPITFQRRPLPPPVPKRQQRPSEVNDVLKKLREIGK